MVDLTQSTEQRGVSKVLRPIGAMLVLFFWLTSVQSQNRLPQEGWYNDLSWVPQTGLTACSVTVGAAGEVAVLLCGQQEVRIFSFDGQFSRTILVNQALPTNDPLAIVSDRMGNLYVAGREGIERYDEASGALLDSFSNLPTEIYTEIDLGPDGNLYVADFANHEIVVLTAAFVPVRTIGQSGTVGAPGTLDRIQGLAVGDDGSVFVRDRFFSSQTGTYFVHEFDATGTFVGRFAYDVAGFASTRSLAYGAGVLYLLLLSNDTDSANEMPLVTAPDVKAAKVLDRSGDLIGALAYARNPNEMEVDNLSDLAAANPDLVFVVGEFRTTQGQSENRVLRFRRAYRTYDPGLAEMVIPEVVASSTRSGTTIVDIRYRLHYAGAVGLQSALLALVDGLRSLGSVREVLTLVDDPMGNPTAGNVGNGVAANAELIVSWDAGVDLAGEGDFANVRMVALGSDGRNPLDMHFLTIPASGPVGCQNLTINVAPITHDELLNVWFWLIGTGDSEITLQGDSVLGTPASGMFDGVLLAQGTASTAQGRDYLFSRFLSGREATQPEVDCLKEATSPGVVNQFAPRTRFGNRPELVNEFGFDTGTSVTGFWVVQP